MWQPPEQQEESVISYPSFHVAVVLRLPARGGVSACIAAVPRELVSVCSCTSELLPPRFCRGFSAPPRAPRTPRQCQAWDSGGWVLGGGTRLLLLLSLFLSVAASPTFRLWRSKGLALALCLSQDLHGDTPSQLSLKDALAVSCRFWALRMCLFEAPVLITCSNHESSLKLQCCCIQRCAVMALRASFQPLNCSLNFLGTKCVNKFGI